MSEKKFADYQKYYCKVADKIQIQYPKFCPTCTPNEKYIEPTWYATTETYLDEKNCLYKFNVTRIIDDLRLDIDEEKLRSFVITLENATTSDRNYLNPAVRSKILRTGIFYILLNQNKTVKNEYICSLKNCAQFTNESSLFQKKYEEFIEIQQKLSFLKSSILFDITDGDSVQFIAPTPELEEDVNSYYEYKLVLDEGEKISEILAAALEELDSLLEQRDNFLNDTSSTDFSKNNFNPYGLEFQAKIEKVYIPPREMGGTPIQFLVSVPSFAIDLIPDASNSDDEDAEDDLPEDFVVAASTFRKNLVTLKSGFFLFAAQYAVARHIDGQAMYYENAALKEYDFDSVVRHLSTVPADGDIDFNTSNNKVFFSLLKEALAANDFRIDNFQLGALFAKKSKNIKFKLSPTPEKPYKVKNIFVESTECDYTKLKGGSARKLIKYLNDHPFVMKFLENIKEMANELTAQKTPEWSQFIPKYSYPPVIIQEAKTNEDLRQGGQAFQCLLDDVGISIGPGAIRNYALEKFISFAKLLAYTFNQNACLATNELEDVNPTYRKWQEYFETDDLNSLNYSRFYEQEVQNLTSAQSIKQIEKIIEDLYEQILTESPNEGYYPSSYLNNIQDNINNLNLQANLESQDFQTTEEYARYLSSLTGIPYLDIQNKLEDAAGAAATSRVEANKGFFGFGKPKGNVFTGEQGHPFLIEAIELAREQVGYEDTFLSMIFDTIQNDLKLVGETDGDGNLSFRDMFSFFGVCGFRSLLGGVLECLLGGVNFQTFIRRFISSQLANLSIEKFGLFVENLPAEQQAIVYREVSQVLGSAVRPWQNGDDFNHVSVSDALQGQKLEFSKDGSPNTSLEEYQALTPEERDSANEQYGRPKVSAQIWNEETQDWDPNPAYQGNVENSTIGKAVSGTLPVIIQAYTNAILNSLDLDILLDKIEDFPGTQLIKKVLFQLACDTKPLIHPPISSVLVSYTPQICNPIVPLAWPKLPKLRNLLNPWKIVLEDIWKIIKAAFLEIINQILIDIIMKIIELLDSLFCRALAGVGKFAGNLLMDSVFLTGQAMSFREAMREAFCGPETPDEKVDELTEALMNNLGFVPSSEDMEVLSNPLSLNSASNTTPAQRAMGVLSGLLTKEEILGFMASERGDYDQTLLNACTNAIVASAPELSPVLGTPEKLANLFQSVSNFLSPAQKDSILDALQNPIPAEPLNNSLCLTNEQYDRWRDTRKRLLEGFGFPEGPATDDLGNPLPTSGDIVDDQDNQINEDLDILINSYTNPLGPIEKACQDLLQENDPNCPTSKGIVPRDTEETKALASQVSDDIFKNLKMSMMRDLFGNDGYMNELLADEKGKSFRRHRFKTWLQKNYVDGEGQAPISFFERGYFPETVGAQMKEQLEKNIGLSNFSFDVYNSDTIIKKRVSAAVKRRPFSDAVLVEEQRDDKVTDSEGNTNELKKKRIRADYPNIKIYKPNMSLKYYDDRFYQVEVFYNDKVLGELTDSIWTQGIIQPTAGGTNFTPVVYSYETRLPSFIMNDSTITIDTNLDNPRAYYTARWLESKMASEIGGSVQIGGFSKAYKSLNKKVSEMVVEYTLKDSEGGDSPGFRFGYKDDALTEEDFEYVNPQPGSTEYTYEEEEGILGRSKTNHPRVIFLDPDVYGGRYKDPKFYIDPPAHTGWLGFAQSLIPGHSFCNDKNVDLLDLNYIKEEVDFYYNRMATDKRLQKERECTVQPPFGKIASRNTKSNLHGICIAITRTYLSQMYLNGNPFFSNVKYSGKNYSQFLSQYVADLMESDISDTPENDSAFIRNKIKGNNYWLLFLEQVVEAYQRMVDLREVQPPENIQISLNRIGEFQKFYRHPNKSDIDKIKENPEFKLDIDENDYFMLTERKEYMKFFKHALAYQAWGNSIFYSENRIKLKKLYKTDRYLYYFRNMCKIFAIKLIEKEAKNVLAAFIEYESEKMFTELSSKVNERPTIDSIVPFLLGKKELTERPAHRYGKTKPIIELEQNGTADFGSVLEVTHNIDDVANNPLNNTSFASEAAEYGRFVIQRYIKVKDREGGSGFPIVDERDEKLFGICNIPKFNQFLKTLNQQKHLSDYFGSLVFIYSATVEELINAGLTLSQVRSLGLGRDYKRLNEETLAQTLEFSAAQIEEFINPEALNLSERDPVRVEGETGLSYGLRICYVPPNSVDITTSAVPREVTLRTKAYGLPKVNGINNSSNLITIADAEVDLIDLQLSDLDLETGDYSYDLLCLFSLIEKSEEYQFMFKTFLPIDSYMSMLALYSNFSFMASWGLGSGERDEPPEVPYGTDPDDVGALRGVKILFQALFSPDDDISGDGDGDEFEFSIFKKTKKNARKIFVNLYNQNDFYDDEASSQDDLFEFMKLFNPFKFPAPPFLSWWQKRKRSDVRCPAAEE